MDLAFDESLFKKVIGVLVAAIVIVGLVAVLWFSGIGFPGQEPAPVTPTPVGHGSDPGPEKEEAVTGWKTYAWSYKETEMVMNLYIPDATHQRFVAASYGSYDEKPQRMAEYVVTDGDDGVIGTVADWFLDTSLALGYGDSDTVANVLAFVESLDYTTDEERLAPPDYPNYPVITLAAGEGDSEDHAILAAAILDKMGYGVGLLYYPATHDRRTIIPEATALALVTDGTVPGRLYWTVAEMPAGKFVYYPENGTFDAALPEGLDLESGWYSGSAVWNTTTASRTLVAIRYHPTNRTFVAGPGVRDIDRIVSEDAVWN